MHKKTNTKIADLSRQLEVLSEDDLAQVGGGMRMDTSTTSCCCGCADDCDKQSEIWVLV